MRDSRTRWSSWILGCVLPARDLEAVMGDLTEEYALRSQSTSAVLASRWYWRQLVRSIPTLLWARVHRGGWLATLGVAVGACIAQATVELASKSTISSLLGPDARVAALLTLLVTLPTLVLVSYLAARIRPGAAIVLTALIIIAVIVQLAVKQGDGMPFWNQIAALLVGPSAAFAGGVLSLRRRC